MVPNHLNITEAGLITKNFIDCGGTVRVEKVISFQVWVAGDTEHRLESTKLLKIIGIAQDVISSEDHEIEIEYQSDTIGKYGIEFSNGNFLLTNKQTNCLASDSCGIPVEKRRINLADLAINQSSCCTPGGGCC
jgi:hypothetical protein